MSVPTTLAAPAVHPVRTGRQRPSRPRAAQPARPVRTGPPRLLLPPLLEEVEPVGSATAPTPPRAVTVRSPLDEAAGPTGPEEDTGTPGLPDPRGLAGPLVLAAQEALMGARPLAQLTRWVTPEVYQRLAGALPLTRTTASRARGRIISTRAVLVSAVAAEATVVLHDGTRVRAAALRLEEHRGRWRATVLDIG